MRQPDCPRSSIMLCLLVVLCAQPIMARQAEQELARTLRGRIEALRATGFATAATDRLLAQRALPAFYEAREFRPAWSIEGEGTAALDELIAAIEQVEEDGLDPEAYHLGSLRRLIGDGGDMGADLADLDLLASDAFLLLGSHLLHGRVDPESVNPEWLANRREGRLDLILADALSEEGVGNTLLRLAPSQARYWRLRTGLGLLREIARTGGWSSIGDGPKLEIGSGGDRVLALRSRLAASGDVAQTDRASDTFDQALGDAVRRFQLRHGLDVDGVVGAATLRALNVSAAERARQIQTNLERWRWLPADLGERHIEVNIAAFDVRVVEGSRTVRVHRAVVGRQYRQTPTFSGTMTYLVLSPYWHVPPTIAAVDKLPDLRANPTSMLAQRIVLLDAITNEALDPSSIDFSSMSGTEFNRRFRLRQDPGPTNALGAVKFMFPNRHNVYLHDTPSRELFARTTRGFSSGCIRVEDALGLAEYLLADQPTWTRSRIDQVVNAGLEQTVRLTRGLPIHLLYWTAWADEEGSLHFRDDLYGRDEAVWRGLTAPPPSP